MRKPNGYWTKEKCKEEVEKYKNRSEFQKYSKGAYKICLKNNWIDELFQSEPNHKPNGYWTEEKCKEEVGKYKNLTEFIKKSASVYRKIKANNWEYLLEVLEQRKPANFWNLENCKQEALKYKTKKEFAEKSISCYTRCLKNNWIDDVCKHMNKIGNKHFRCIYSVEFSDNHLYIGLTYNFDERKLQHLSTDTSSVYKHIINTGLTPTFKQLSDYIEVNEATKLEGSKIEEYKKLGWNILNKAKSGAIGGKNIKWTKEKCMEESLKYETRIDFKKSSPKAYDAAFRHKYLQDICEHMKPLTNRNYYKHE